MTSLIPLYLKTVYKDDPVFQSAKILYSAYENEISETFNNKFLEIAAINNLEEEDLGIFLNEDKIDLDKGAVTHSDILIKGSENLNGIVSDVGQELGVTVINYEENIDELLSSHIELYNQITEE